MHQITTFSQNAAQYLLARHGMASLHRHSGDAGGGFPAWRIAGDEVSTSPLSTKPISLSTIDILQTLLIHATAFLFRWFRELQDRSVILKVQESQARVQAVRSAQASRRRRQGVSAAEELIDMIDTVRQNVLTKRTALREKGPTPLLDDTEETLMGCIKKLARGAQDETSINREGGSTEARTAEEAATEDMFLEMYRKPGAARKNEEMRSNRRKQSNVRFGTSVVYGIGGDSQEQQIYDGEGNAIGSMPTRARSVKFTIDGVAMPRLSLVSPRLFMPR